MRPQIHPVGRVLAACAWLVCGPTVRWVGAKPGMGPSVYFANHTSHLDFLVLWAALPPPLRAVTRPVAALDYWTRGPVRRWLARSVFRSVLVARPGATGRDPGPESRPSGGGLERMEAAIDEGDSIILFPEGTRGTGEEIAPFRSGLYHLAARRPALDLIPVFIENLNRILPKGEFLPVPLAGRLTFGPTLRLEAGEARDDFLARARRAVWALRES